MSKEPKGRYNSNTRRTVDSLNSTMNLAKNEAQLPENILDQNSPYNPFEHRNVEHPNTYFGVLVHFIKGSLCTGILAMPMAFESSGVITGIVGTFLVGVLCLHTVHMLVAASQEICKKTKTPTLDFAETVEAVFKHGPKRIRKYAISARYFMDITLFLTYYLSNAVFIVFMATHIQQCVNYFQPAWADVPKPYYMVSIMLLLMIFCQIRDLKHLVIFSLIANVNMLIAIIITLYYIFRNSQDLSLDQVKLYKPITELPLFFVTALFGMEGIGTVLYLENSLKKPEQFLSRFGILNVAMTCVTFIFTVLGLSGYLKYKEHVQASIIQNLPSHEPAAQVAKICVSISIFSTFMLQFYVPVDITWRKVVKQRVKEKYYNMAQIIMRLVLLVIVTVIAIGVPNLGVIICIVGAVCFSTLGLFIPAVVDTVLKWDGRLGRFYWRLVKNMLIILLSNCAMVSGTYIAIIKLINGED